MPSKLVKMSLHKSIPRLWQNFAQAQDDVQNFEPRFVISADWHQNLSLETVIPASGHEHLWYVTLGDHALDSVVSFSALRLGRLSQWQLGTPVSSSPLKTLR